MPPRPPIPPKKAGLQHSTPVHASNILGSNHRSQASALSIEKDYIKISPVLVGQSIGKESIDSLKEKSIQELRRNIDDIRQNIPETNGDDVVLFRFHTGDEGLQSEAEKHDQTTLPEGIDVAKQFLDKHARENQKTIDIEGTQYYSPLVSTTKDMHAFIDASFTPQVGDTNLRQDVFEQATNITIFVVPKEFCLEPQQSTAFKDVSHKPDLSSLEKEVCYNTQHGSLQKYQHQRFDNPFRGRVDVRPLDLAMSRHNVDTEEGSRISEMKDRIPRKETITETIRKDYIEYYQVKEDYCTKISTMPRKGLVKEQKIGATTSPAVGDLHSDILVSTKNQASPDITNKKSQTIKQDRPPLHPNSNKVVSLKSKDPITQTHLKKEDRATQTMGSQALPPLPPGRVLSLKMKELLIKVKTIGEPAKQFVHFSTQTDESGVSPLSNTPSRTGSNKNSGMSK